MFLIQLLCIAVCLSMITGQPPLLISSDRLPGMDTIESGFNAISMTAVDKESRFRIFDMNDNGKYPFRLTVGHLDRLYNTPLQGQVTKIGRRRDRNCESVSTDFKQFHSSFFQSTRTAGGFSVPFFSITVSTHETLKRVHEAITKRSQAVGTSTSWWGLYSIQLGPPSVLKLDPMFNASVTTIVNLGPTPTSESGQSLYNMLVETYGTHYTTHVIMGASAHIYTFINENYAKSTSFEEVTKQVSKSGSFFFFNINEGSSLHSVVNTIDETFRKNSESMATYEPPVVAIPGKTEWQSWVTNAPLQPVVVNRTIAPLSNLLYQHPTVQAHLKRTINYYLTNGNLPTYAQLQK